MCQQKMMRWAICRLGEVCHYSHYSYDVDYITQYGDYMDSCSCNSSLQSNDIGHARLPEYRPLPPDPQKDDHQGCQAAQAAVSAVHAGPGKERWSCCVSGGVETQPGQEGTVHEVLQHWASVTSSSAERNHAYYRGRVAALPGGHRLWLMLAIWTAWLTFSLDSCNSRLMSCHIMASTIAVRKQLQLQTLMLKCWTPWRAAAMRMRQRMVVNTRAYESCLRLLLAGTFNLWRLLRLTWAKEEARFHCVFKLRDCTASLHCAFRSWSQALEDSKLGPDTRQSQRDHVGSYASGCIAKNLLPELPSPSCSSTPRRPATSVSLARQVDIYGEDSSQGVELNFTATCNLSQAPSDPGRFAVAELRRAALHLQGMADAAIPGLCCQQAPTRTSVWSDRPTTPPRSANAGHYIAGPRSFSSAARSTLSVPKCISPNISSPQREHPHRSAGACGPSDWASQLRGGTTTAQTHEITAPPGCPEYVARSGSANGRQSPRTTSLGPGHGRSVQSRSSSCDPGRRAWR